MGDFNGWTAEEDEGSGKGTAGAGNCGEVADAAVLCPSFYQAEIVSNPSESEKRRASRSRRIISWLQTRRDAKRIAFA